MTLQRLVGVIGFCFMLMSMTVIAHTFFLSWLFGTEYITLYLNRFDERVIELLLVFFGFSFIPITIYELDRLLRDED